MQIDIKGIDYKYINEEIIERYEKAYSTVLFSPNYVFKVFHQKDDLYNAKAAEDEYEWDCSMPFLNPVFHKICDSNGNEYCMLVMNRLPVQSNLLFKLINHTLTTDTIVEVGQKILALQDGYEGYDLSSDELYENYISNMNMQISYLNEKLSLSLKKKINDIVASNMCKDAFSAQGNDISCSIVHGNMFTGNIFLYCDDLVIIDPISIFHLGRYSYPDIDIATYLADLKLLLPEEDYNLCFNHITKSLPLLRIHLINFYLLLKLLVRLRFAYIELELPNLTHEKNMNCCVTKVGFDILSQHIGELYSALDCN